MLQRRRLAKRDDHDDEAPDDDLDRWDHDDDHGA
jgi:hypothetical protein